MKRELQYHEWMKYIHNYQINKDKEMKREIAVNQVIVPTYYIRNEDGTIEYDFEEMANEFERLLSDLDENVVVMCSVIDQNIL